MIDEAYGQNENREAVKGCKRIFDECETCMKLWKNPEKPVVQFAIGRIFNEVIGVDVGELEGEKFLMTIDLPTHYCQGGWIQNKAPPPRK